ncbi:ammonium transporter Rh type A-like [Daphnia pulicaria]|uniref:ammonium transporter Rh type A-like n=1 Tax=Daphnia pulicaria TaxID=35523 RepID=UPI001EECB384|nr:ammonium transporter Rh type A-like [Daphnia pulicaria]
MSWNNERFLTHGRHIPFLLGLQVVFIILFGVFVEYDPMAHSARAFDANATTNEGNNLGHYYPMFQDVHVMMFIGFGFLMTFLKKYGYSAVALNFLIAAIVLQWATLCQGFYHTFDGQKIYVSITSLLNADFASATVLISFGAVIGVTTPLQLAVMAVCEIAIFASNEHLGLEVLRISDVGASMLVHVFGAYFGLAVSCVLRRDVSSEKEGATYNSDIFAMIGTIFLWLFWPSFNAGLAEGDAQHRAVINTYYSLAACCVTAFAVSALVSKEQKFDMVHIQNSTLAGGVAIGTSADMMIHPFGAMIVGSISGTVSVLGYRYLTPVINKKLGIHDTCGVHNLHGMPGVIAGIVGAITASVATQEEYGYSLYRQFSARAPLAGTPEFIELEHHVEHLHAGLDRSASMQGGYQIATLFVTMAVAISGGLVTGFILRLPIFGKVPWDHLFDDELSWEVPEADHHQNRTASSTPMVHRAKSLGETPL